MEAGDDEVAVVVDLGGGVDDLFGDVAFVAGHLVVDDGPCAVGVGEGFVGEEVAEGEVLALVAEEAGPVDGGEAEDGVGAGEGGFALVDEVVDAVVDEELALDGGAAVEGKAGGRGGHAGDVGDEDGVAAEVVVEGAVGEVEGGGAGGDGVLDPGPVGELLLEGGAVDEGDGGDLVAGEFAEGLVEDGLGFEEPHEADVDEEDGVEAGGEEGEDAGDAPEG